MLQYHGADGLQVPSSALLIVILGLDQVEPEDDERREKKPQPPDSETPPEGGNLRRRGASSRGEHDKDVFADRRRFSGRGRRPGFERGEVSNRLSDR